MTSMNNGTDPDYKDPNPQATKAFFLGFAIANAIWIFLTLGSMQ